MIDSRPVVLIVEDDQSIANLLRINLDLAGFKTILAMDGNQAVELFNKNRVDLVLLDLMLPGKDGWEILAYINEKSNGLIPVVITSAKTQRADLTKGFEMGIAYYITKPFDPEELVDRIKTILKKSK